MENGNYQIEIVTRTTKKTNMYIIAIFVLLLLLCIFSVSIRFYFLVLVWMILAGFFLFYDYKHSKSIFVLSTKLLFNDEGFSIVIDDNHFNLQIKKDDVTIIKFDQKTNHIIILHDDTVLCDICVKPKTLIELYDVFNSFGYKCELSSYV